MQSIERLLGGSPVATLLKLLFLCLVIGAILAGFGFTPSTVPRRALAALRSVLDLGFGAFADIGRYILTGAVVVIPIWLVMRIMRGRS
jgi:hypothetical protein